jgi:hypothetical protein
MRYLLLLTLMLSFALARATQTDDPGLPGTDPDVPVDGGVAALLVAGVVYGIRKIKRVKL